MYKIDSFIQKKLQDLDKYPELQKLQDLYAAQDDKAQQLIKTVALAIIFVVPVIISLTLLSSNNSLKKELIIKNEILSIAGEIIQKNNLLPPASRKVMGLSFVSSLGELQSAVSPVIASLGIDSSLIRFNNFELVEEAANINNAIATLEFQKLSNDQLFSLISSLNVKLKIKIDKISIRIHEETKLLNGEFRIHYFSKEIFNE